MNGLSSPNSYITSGLFSNTCLSYIGPEISSKMPMGYKVELFPMLLNGTASVPNTIATNTLNLEVDDDLALDCDLN